MELCFVSPQAAAGKGKETGLQYFYADIVSAEILVQ